MKFRFILILFFCCSLIYSFSSINIFSTLYNKATSLGVFYHVSYDNFIPFFEIIDPGFLVSVSYNFNSLNLNCFSLNLYATTIYSIPSFNDLFQLKAGIGIGGSLWYVYQKSNIFLSPDIYILLYITKLNLIDIFDNEFVDNINPFVNKLVLNLGIQTFFFNNNKEVGIINGFSIGIGYSF